MLTNCGFPIMQGMGMSETSSIAAINTNHVQRTQCVGQILSGAEGRIYNLDVDGVAGKSGAERDAYESNGYV